MLLGRQPVLGVVGQVRGEHHPVARPSAGRAAAARTGSVYAAHSRPAPRATRRPASQAPPRARPRAARTQPTARRERAGRRDVLLAAAGARSRRPPRRRRPRAARRSTRPRAATLPPVAPRAAGRAARAVTPAPAAAGCWPSARSPVSDSSVPTIGSGVTSATSRPSAASFSATPTPTGPPTGSCTTTGPGQAGQPAAPAPARRATSSRVPGAPVPGAPGASRSQHDRAPAAGTASSSAVTAVPQSRPSTPSRRALGREPVRRAAASRSRPGPSAASRTAPPSTRRASRSRTGRPRSGRPPGRTPAPRPAADRPAPRAGSRRATGAVGDRGSPSRGRCAARRCRTRSGCGCRGPGRPGCTARRAGSVGVRPARSSDQLGLGDLGPGHLDEVGASPVGERRVGRGRRDHACPAAPTGHRPAAAARTAPGQVEVEARAACARRAGRRSPRTGRRARRPAGRPRRPARRPVRRPPPG